MLVGIFPLLLVFFEMGVRFLLQKDVFEFVGPTLCVAALSFLVPLTRVKRRKVVASGQGNKVAYYEDHDFVQLVLIILFIFLLLWGVSFFLSVQPPNKVLTIIHVPVHAAIGAALYVSSVYLTYLKDRR
ncbi:hypothetical protein [Sphingomonas phyllosphaerae]|uniref:hypothetical protein n=1 Tax=Sphingomonas phyllosphaerae TaxID=257003 RepID=UPI001EE36E7D|nr:hypothetical protein [Sphingomonas phyllosphaerae]